MANLNLSQFGENTSVSDADYTFVWDSANSISKKVSRNSWLTSPSLSTSAPVTISQTWNAVGQTFKALVVNAAGTSDANSASGSLLADFQLGSVSKVRVRKDGTIFVPGGSNGAQGVSTTANYMCFATALGSINQYGSSLYSTTGLLNLGSFSFNVGTITFDAAGKLDWGDAAIVKDSTNTLALRNGTNAQTFNVYGTYTSITDYRRLSISVDNTTGNATITANKGSATTGDVGTVSINGIVASAGGNSLSFAGSNGSVLSQNNYINLQSNAYAAVQVTGARGAGNEPSSIACIYGPNSGAIDATSAFKIYRRTGGVDSVPFMVNSAGNVGIGTTAPGAKLEVVGESSNILVLKNAAQSVLSVTSGGGAGTIAFSHSNSPNLMINQSTGNKITLGVGSNNLQSSNSLGVPIDLIIQGTGGNVGIGTTSPTSKLHVAGNALITGNVSLSDGTVTVLGTRGFTLTPADGIFQFLNNAQTGFDRIQLGGASTGHPAIKRNGASIDITLASDGITFTSIQDLYRRFGANSPEGAVVAPIGAVFHRTDGGAGTSFYVKESGTGNTGWVGK